MRLAWLLIFLCLLFLGVVSPSHASPAGQRRWRRHKLKHRHPEPDRRRPRRKFNGGTVRHPLFEGSGCPAASVLLVNASDTTSFSLSALFAEFQAQTSDATTRKRQTCTITVALEPQANMSIGVAHVDFRGSAYVPASASLTQQSTGYAWPRHGPRMRKATPAATLKASYRLTGSKRERAVDRTFEAGFDDAFYEAVDVDAVVWTPCDAGEGVRSRDRVFEFRITATITASKAAPEDDDVAIAVDTSDSSLQKGLYYELTSRPCGAVASEATAVPSPMQSESTSPLPSASDLVESALAESDGGSATGTV